MCRELSVANLRLRTADRLQPLLHRQYLVFIAFQLSAHRALGCVHAPAGQAQCLRLLFGVFAEEDALHVTEHLEIAHIPPGVLQEDMEGVGGGGEKCTQMNINLGSILFG